MAKDVLTEAEAQQYAIAGIPVPRGTKPTPEKLTEAEKTEVARLLEVSYRLAGIKHDR